MAKSVKPAASTDMIEEARDPRQNRRKARTPREIDWEKTLQRWTERERACIAVAQGGDHGGEDEPEIVGSDDGVLGALIVHVPTSYTGTVTITLAHPAKPLPRGRAA